MLSDSSSKCVCVYICRHYDFSLFLIQCIKIALLKKNSVSNFPSFLWCWSEGMDITTWKSLPTDYHIFIPLFAERTKCCISSNCNALYKSTLSGSCVEEISSYCF